MILKNYNLKIKFIIKLIFVVKKNSDKIIKLNLNKH